LSINYVKWKKYERFFETLYVKYEFNKTDATRDGKEGHSKPAVSSLLTVFKLRAPKVLYTTCLPFYSIFLNALLNIVISINTITVNTDNSFSINNIRT